MTQIMLIVTVIAGLLIAFNHNDVDAFNSRADAYRFKEQYNEAISDHTKAILLDTEKARPKPAWIIPSVRLALGRGLRSALDTSP